MKRNKLVRPYRACLWTLAAGMAVLLCGQVCLHMAYPRQAVRFQLKTGNITELEGFTLEGSWGQTASADMEFTLSDGVLNQHPDLRAKQEDGLSLMAQSLLCVPDDELAGMDQQAEGGYVSGSYGAFFLRTSYEGMKYTAQAGQLNQMYTLNTLDGTNLSVRFSLGQVQLPQAVTVTAELYENGRARDSYPYLVNAAELETADIGIRKVTILDAEDPVSLYVSPGNGQNGGIYLVREFCTAEETAKIVPAVTVQGFKVPSENQPYGTVEEVCTLDAGESLISCDNWEDARIGDGHWILTRQETGKINLRLLDGEWSPIGKLPLDISVAEYQSVVVLPPLRMDEISFIVVDQTGAGQAIVLRMNQQTIEAQCAIDFAATSAPIAAGYSADGSRLMTVTETRQSLMARVPAEVCEYYNGAEDLTQEVSSLMNAVTGWDIHVYNTQDLKRPTLSVCLDFGITQRWRQELWLNGVYGGGRKISLYRVTSAWERAGEGTA